MGVKIKPPARIADRPVTAGAPAPRRLESRASPCRERCAPATYFDAIDSQLLRTVAEGLPLVPRPYAAVGEALGIAEVDVMQRLALMHQRGLIKRFGVIVRHHELGYRANGMVVWDIRDDLVARVGQCFGDHEFVTLCYRRPRRPPQWRYNLFTMIHGRDRADVLARVDELVASCGIPDVVHEVLFSGRRFKQRGALYDSRLPTAVQAFRALAADEGEQYGPAR